jgi:hypothetical protein
MLQELLGERRSHYSEGYVKYAQIRFFLFSRKLTVKAEILVENIIKASRIIVLLLAFPFLCSTAFSQDASHCISEGLTAKGEPYFANNCEDRVEIAWCSTNVVAGADKNLPCGGEHYYTKNDYIEPHDKKINSYVVPKGGQFVYGACFGTYRKLVYTSSEAYSCKPVNSVDQDFVTVTAADKTSEAACATALKLASPVNKGQATADLCLCDELKPGLSRCKVTVLGNSPKDKSIFQWTLERIRKVLRDSAEEEWVKCKAQPKGCESHGTAATGVRG